MGLFRRNLNETTAATSWASQALLLLEADKNTPAPTRFKNFKLGVGKRATPGEIRFISLFLPLLVLVKALVSLLLWRSGYLEYDADGFTRSLQAWNWSQHGGIQVDAWLPLQFWLNGSLMHLWPDLLHLPRLVNFTASIITTINFFLIGYQLFGRTNAYFTAMLAALFPWEIWFGLSGMSESLTNMFLSLGVVFFVRWLTLAKSRYLYWAGLGLLGATAVRYEAWFYSVIYVALVLLIAYRHKIFNFKMLIPLVIPFLFVIFWLGLSFVQRGSPLAFADITSELNHRLDSQNQQLNLWGRLGFYPRTLLELAWRLTIPAVLGSLLLIWQPIRQARPYLALIWGEFALFILTTLPYNNIAPGSARYPVSNLLLLLPIVVYLFQRVAGKLSRRWQRLGVQLILIALIFSQLQIIFSRSFDFPSVGIRQSALWLKNGWASDTLPQNSIIPLNLPPTSYFDYNAYYALRVLTNHPDNFRIYQDFNDFKTSTTSPENPPVAWVQLNSALGPDNKEPVSAAEDKPLIKAYREVLQFGEVKIGIGALFKAGQTWPKVGNARQLYQFQADEFTPGESVDVWVSRDDNSIKPLGQFRADAGGKVTLQYQPDRATPGHWAITAHSQSSGRYAIGRFDLQN